MEKREFSAADAARILHIPEKKYSPIPGQIRKINS